MGKSPGQVWTGHSFRERADCRCVGKRQKKRGSADDPSSGVSSFAPAQTQIAANRVKGAFFLFDLSRSGIWQGPDDGVSGDGADGCATWKWRSGRLTVLPVVCEAAIEMRAAKGEDGVGAFDGPEHAGLFEAMTDDSLA